MMVARIDDECSGSANKNNIPALLKRIRNLKALKRVDIDEVYQISEALHGEWKMMKSRFKKKLIRNDSFITKLYIEQEVDEEIIFGLFHFLNEKIIGSLKLS